MVAITVESARHEEMRSASLQVLASEQFKGSAIWD
jgi:hypothetical protein